MYMLLGPGILLFWTTVFHRIVHQWKENFGGEKEKKKKEKAEKKEREKKEKEESERKFRGEMKMLY